MSGVVNIRSALESALNAMSPALLTSFENVSFTPPVSTVPYQVCNLLFAEPENIEYGSGHRENGYLQIRLMYPLQIGTSTINARAELIRTTFYRGASFSNSGVNVVINKTPEVSPGAVDGDRFSIIVKVRFFANI